MKTIKIFSFFVLSLLLMVSACKNANNQEEDIIIDGEDEKLVYPLPTPFEVTQMLEEFGIPYNLGLTNDIAKAELYNSEKSKSLNLGVYSADLTYAATYNQAQATRDILASAKKIADNLNISDVFNKDIVDRVEQNIQNSDSLYKLVSEMDIKTFNKLIKRGQGVTAMLVITGAWVESVYIATQLSITSTNQKGLMTKIAEQKYNINILIPLLSEYNVKSGDISDFIVKMEKFKTIFDKIENDDDGNMMISQDIIDELTEYAAEVRKEIIDLR